MNRINTLTLLATIAACSLSATAQAPTQTIDPQRHGNLAAAQGEIAQAYARMTDAQQANNAHLGGHAQRAKELLEQANQEIVIAAQQADADQGDVAPAPAPFALENVTGNWTIFAYNIRKPGSSLKEVHLFQNGSVITGTFKGPYQKGKLQGWINGNHVEFSTDTREVLTFRGEIRPDGMSGLYGVNGEHAQWKAQRN